MKIIKILIGLFIVLGPNNIFGQKQFSEGSLTYSISISGLKADAGQNNLSQATLQVYLKPTVSRTEMVSSLGTESNIFDNKSGKGFMLKEYSGQKLMITMTKENWKQKNQLYENLTFKVAEGYTEIEGQKCKKAIAEIPGGKMFTVYFNPDIEISNTNYNNAFGHITGLPVQYEMQSGNLSFTYTLNKISWDPVSNSKFEIPKTGFRMMTYDENQQLKKGEK